MKIGLFCLFFGLNTVLAQNRCQTGKCVDLRNCPKLMEHITKSSRDSRSFEIVRKRNCGYNGRDPLVCCTHEEQHFVDEAPRHINTSASNNNKNNSANEKPKKNNGNDKLGSKLLPKECTNRYFTRRIIGGNETDREEFPWLVLLEYDTLLGQQFGCGGSLINDRYVLTAAHCVTNLPIGRDLKSVRLGEYDTDTDPDCSPVGEEGSNCSPASISVPIEKKIAYDNYETKNHHSDIALLRLSRKVEFTNTIKPICLPNSSSLAQKFIVSGWGLTEQGTYSNIKLKVAVPLSNSCKTKYMSLNPPRQIISSQICAGGEKGKDTCTGDSGGPLMQKESLSDGQISWIAVGVCSFGTSPCGKEGWPGIYTNVFYFKPWIISQLRP